MKKLSRWEQVKYTVKPRTQMKLLALLRDFNTEVKGVKYLCLSVKGADWLSNTEKSILGNMLHGMLGYVGSTKTIQPAEVWYYNTYGYWSKGEQLARDTLLIQMMGRALDQGFNHDGTLRSR